MQKCVVKVGGMVLEVLQLIKLYKNIYAMYTYVLKKVGKTSSTQGFGIKLNG